MIYARKPLAFGGHWEGSQGDRASRACAMLRDHRFSWRYLRGPFYEEMFRLW